MSLVFTELVRKSEDPSDAELFNAAWRDLGGLLRLELRRRGLWKCPPSYLGIFGWTGWDSLIEGRPPGEDLELLDEGPLAELTAECFTFVFVDRLAALKAQLLVKPNIEGLVLLNVRHFLLERQRRHDPLGYRVFEMLLQAVREAISRGELYVLAGDPAVRNETVLGFIPEAEPDTPAHDLAGIVAHWNDDLLPELVTARGKEQLEVQDRLRALLRDLWKAGYSSFRFRDVIDPLKNDTRMRWAARMEDAAAEPRGLASQAARAHGEAEPRATLPELPIEERDNLAELAGRVAAAIEGLATDRRTRGYLATLWTFLHTQANADQEERPGRGAVVEDEEWGHLSHRKLAQLLGIPRERLPELFATLRKLVEESRREGSRRAAASAGKLASSGRMEACL